MYIVIQNKYSIVLYNLLFRTKIKVKKYKPKAVWIVHIGGHIAFEIDKIANYCKQNKIIILLENINTKLIRISFYLNQYIN